ncbi:MAG: DUF1361 domain-containing protein [Bacteroidota bacterium]
MLQKKQFLKNRQSKLSALLLSMTIFNVLLVVFRLNWVGFDWGGVNYYRDVFFFRNEPTFLFLIWNLFLAWIPYLLSLVVKRLQTKGKLWPITLALIGLWLLFFPNAPYLVTDLLHLKQRSIIPYWYDVILFLSFSVTGLLLGLMSLYPIHQFFKQYLPKPLEHGLIILLIFLGSLGVYIGRFLRWNSWDIIYQPKGLLTDLHNILFYPSELFPELGITALFFFLLYPLYWLVKTMMESNSKVF